MKRNRKLKAVKSKKKSFSIRNPIAPPSVRHSSVKGSGYNRLHEKRKFKREVEDLL